MANLRFAIICDNAFIDDSGRLNIIQTFDTLKAANFPAIHPRLTVVVGFLLGEKDSKTEEYRLNISIKPVSDNKEIASVTNNVTPSSIETRNIQFISYFVGLPLKGDGEYSIEFELVGKVKKQSIPLFVERA